MAPPPTTPPLSPSLLPASQDVAIKRVDPALVEGHSDSDFSAVAANMARFKHPNVVALLGYCIDYGERVMVFEHCSEGSLYQRLHGLGTEALTWSVRLDIALGAAKALK